ncbi:hypothetical protein ILYODFUR_026144 [Ilyodon furcidens]|uniref:Uncharacterized protein n=1 Tax=Ilyodon furcidens TaxID=33524 RepID=A0ABV0UV94_9TELE
MKQSNPPRASPNQTQISKTCTRTKTPCIPFQQGHTTTDELHPRKADEDTYSQRKLHTQPHSNHPRRIVAPPHGAMRQQGKGLSPPKAMAHPYPRGKPKPTPIFKQLPEHIKYQTSRLTSPIPSHRPLMAPRDIDLM